jgi:tryptophan synthase alpha subunit
MPQQQMMQAPGPKQPGLMAQMATTAAGVAVGSAVVSFQANLKYLVLGYNFLPQLIYYSPINYLML